MDSSSCFSNSQTDSASKSGFYSQAGDFWFKASGISLDTFVLHSLSFPPSVCLSLVDLPWLTTSTGNLGNRWVGPSAFHLVRVAQELVQQVTVGAQATVLVMLNHTLFEADEKFGVKSLSK